MSNKNRAQYKTPWIVSDNDKFIGAIYTTKRGNDITLNSKSTIDEVIGWVSTVSFDKWMIRLDEDNPKNLIDSRINLYTKLFLNHYRIGPLIKQEVKALNEKINNTVKERRGLDKGSPTDHWLELRINESLYHRDKLEKLLERTKKPKSSTIDYITEQDIDRAKEYPIDSLLDFNRAGYHTCLFHNEDTASMYYYKNTNHCWCFGCNKTADAISVYRELHGVSFIEAVKKLSGK